MNIPVNVNSVDAEKVQVIARCGNAIVEAIVAADLPQPFTAELLDTYGGWHFAILDADGDQVASRAGSW